MSADDPAFLIVPGLGDSGPGHWQSLWAGRGPTFRRLHQRDWNAPGPDWIAALDAELRRRPVPTVLVAHSLGCTTVAAWAQAHDPGDVVGALLVAPPDTPRVERLGGTSLAPLPFPSVVVASSDDPCCRLERARQFAHHWGARFVDLGPCGHINVAAGFGAWPAGERLLAGLVRRARRVREPARAR